MGAPSIVVVRDAVAYVAVLVMWFSSMVVILRRFQHQTEVMDKLLVAVTFLGMILQVLVTYYTTIPSTEVYQKVPITDEGEFSDTASITFTITPETGSFGSGGGNII